METPVEAPRRRSLRHQLPATTPSSAMHPFFSNQVLLHDWWLIKVDSDSHGKRLGIGGFTCKDGTETIRCFSSTPIVKSLDAVTLNTDDGMTVMLLGCVNKSRTLENGFSLEVSKLGTCIRGLSGTPSTCTNKFSDFGQMCDHFLIGFPYDWEEYTDLSVSEEAANLSPALETHKLRGHEANKIGSQKDGKIKGGNVEHSGPLTRSRTRLLDN